VEAGQVGERETEETTVGNIHQAEAIKGWFDVEVWKELAVATPIIDGQADRK
jgi:hypothetical protein